MSRDLIPELSYEKIAAFDSVTLSTLSDALENHGFFTVTNHGVNDELLDDSYDLAKKMKIMLRMSASDREKMGERGRNKMLNNFDEAIVLDKYNNVIVDLLKKNSEKLI